MEHKRAKRIAEGARALLLQDQSKQAKKMREQKKKVKELSKNGKKGGPDLEAARNVIDDIKSEMAATQADLKLIRHTLDTTTALLQDAAEELLPFEDNRDSSDMSVLEVIDYRLAQRRIYRTVYHGRTFIGPHIKKMMRRL